MGIKILFVDDDSNIQKMVEIFLRNQDYQITFVKNGRSALKFFKADNYDLLITDVQMPEMDGLTLTKEIRKIDLKIPIILVTAFGQERLADEDQKENFSVLNKPFESKGLIEAIKKSITP